MSLNKDDGSFEQNHPVLSEVVGHVAEGLGMLESSNGPVIQSHKVFSTEKLSSNQELTPEGYLLCKNTPIARIGSLLYDKSELSELEPGNNGLIIVNRDPEEVFHPDAIASFLGKSITDDHPDDLVSPETYTKHTVGTILNVRQGSGIDNDVLVADLLICDADTIKAVQSGKKELSCGYNADYEQDTPGRAAQRNIRGNHVALVEQGRCGPRCSIRDKQMANAPTKSWKDRILEALRVRDQEIKDCIENMDKEEQEEKEEKESKKETKDVHIHVNNKAEDTSNLDAWRKGVDSALQTMKDMLEEMVAKQGQMQVAGAPAGAVPIQANPPVLHAAGATPPAENADEKMEKSETGELGGGEEEEKEAREQESNDENGKLSESTRKEIGEVGSEKREEEPEGAFLKPGERKYPVKTKKGGEYKYDRNLLLAAARRARMNGDDELAKKADGIREREFGGDTKDTDEEVMDALDAMYDWSHTGEHGQGGSGGAPSGDPVYGSNAGPKDYGNSGEKTANPIKGTDSAEPEEEGECKGTKDSATLVLAWNDTISRAEKLAPGLKAPTFDSKASSKTTKDAMCLFRRRALAAAFDGASADIVKPLVVSKQNITNMSCDAIRVAFIAASDAAGEANNDRHRGSGADTPVERTRNLLRDMNKAAREAWDQK